MFIPHSQVWFVPQCTASKGTGNTYGIHTHTHTHTHSCFVPTLNLAYIFFHPPFYTLTLPLFQALFYSSIPYLLSYSQSLPCYIPSFHPQVSLAPCSSVGNAYRIVYYNSVLTSSFFLTVCTLRDIVVLEYFVRQYQYHTIRCLMFYALPAYWYSGYLVAHERKVICGIPEAMKPLVISLYFTALEVNIKKFLAALRVNNTIFIGKITLVGYCYLIY